MKKSLLEELLDEAVELLSNADVDGLRALLIRAPEDAEVRELCERRGYGAVMDSACRQWFLKDPGANHTTGHCAAVIGGFLKRVAAAKAEQSKRERATR
jgi:hypothetical protein